MPHYMFRLAGEPSDEHLDLPDDQAAWSEIVKWCGEMLLDADGTLKDGTEIELMVFRDTGHPMGTIKVVASRPRAAP